MFAPISVHAVVLNPNGTMKICEAIDYSITNAAWCATPIYPETKISISKAHQSEQEFRTAGSARSI